MGTNICAGFFVRIVRRLANPFILCNCRDFWSENWVYSVSRLSQAAVSLDVSLKESSALGLVVARKAILSSHLVRVRVSACFLYACFISAVIGDICFIILWYA